MKITTSDKIKLIISMYSVLKWLPNLKQKIFIFFIPIDTVRFHEFSYFIKFIKKNKLSNLYILDISSPHMMAYFLSKHNNVEKTNIDINEKKFIKEKKNLKFKIENAINLTYQDNKFDLTYSISVIEHIYVEYIKAVQEMIRVTKSGGFIYITFPVSRKHKEEWTSELIYSNQKIIENKVFFQYRFDDIDISLLLDSLKNVEIIAKDIYWEKNNGLYNKVMSLMKVNLGFKFFNLFKNSFINAYYGFTMLSNESSNDFENSKNFGNIHLIFKKT